MNRPIDNPDGVGDLDSPELHEQPEGFKSVSPVSIRYDIDAQWLVISDINRALFRDGDKEYYDKPRDERPIELNPFDIQDITQVYYMLSRVAANSFGLNKAPVELVEMLDKLQMLCEITEAVANHCIAIIVNPAGTPQVPPYRKKEKHE